MSTVRPSAFNLPTDLAIARTAPILHISEIAEKSGIREDELEYYGRYKAKVHLDILKRLASRPPGKYVDVTAITPTPLGEGKTVTTIGLSQGLARIGKSVFTTLRQPSLGPVFGIKGGAAGGGYSQVIPMEDFNLHFTGDVHAVSAAHNLLAAFLDNHLHHGNRLDLDPHSILWPRVLDISDRALRHIIVGLGGKENGFPRESGFDISVASEVMAVLALSEDLADLRKRLGRIIPCFNRNKLPVTAEDLKCAGAMAVLLREALMPNLIQTLEHTPCFVHAGPFANIAHGNSSIIADRIALRLAEYTVTESGFGADCGAEKFMDIKCRAGGLIPSCVVLVCSVRALKMHGGLARVVAGKPLDEELSKENLPALEKGAENLRKQIENILVFGIPVVVSINRFAADTDRELELIRSMAISAGAEDAVPGEYWARGGEGARDLSLAVVEACEKPSEFRFLYPLEMPIKEKIHAIGTKIYGADGIEYSPVAEKKIKTFTSLGFDSLPVCMAKTHLSLSHEPSWKGRPRNYTLPVRDVRLSAGAGFLTPLCGDMRTMPGLPSDPAGAHMDIDEEGNVEGLF
jgi:formate--tetrahydrofolate ligase